VCARARLPAAGKAGPGQSIARGQVTGWVHVLLYRGARNRRWGGRLNTSRLHRRPRSHGQDPCNFPEQTQKRFHTDNLWPCLQTRAKQVGMSFGTGMYVLSSKERGVPASVRLQLCARAPPSARACLA
jgi:hypothetical protein